MLFPQARRVSPRTVLLRRKTTPRDRRMFTTSVAAALIQRALVRKPRKAKSCGGNGDPDGTVPSRTRPNCQLGSRYLQHSGSIGVVVGPDKSKGLGLMLAGRPEALGATPAQPSSEKEGATHEVRDWPLKTQLPSRDQARKTQPTMVPSMPGMQLGCDGHGTAAQVGVSQVQVQLA